MQGYVITIASAFFCVISRCCLNIIDRSVLRREDVNFWMGMVYNAIFPLVFALIYVLLMGTFDRSILVWMLEPGVILSGLGAQLAGTAFSACLRSMRVRNVMVTSKSCDLVIPIATALVTHRLSFGDYVLSNLTTLAFLPIALSVFKKREYSIRMSLILTAALLFQAVVNSYFHVANFAKTWDEFSKLMICILTWRTLFILMPFFWKNHAETKISALPVSVFFVLLARGCLAFLSQAAFFLSITRDKGFIAWPILNAGPLISCYLAHWFLKEWTGSPERKALLLFCAALVGYLITKGVFS